MKWNICSNQLPQEAMLVRQNDSSLNREFQLYNKCKIINDTFLDVFQSWPEKQVIHSTSKLFIHSDEMIIGTLIIIKSYLFTFQQKRIEI